MKASTRAVINEMVAKAEYKKNNGPIAMTPDQLWKYSGKTEEPTVIINKWNSNKIDRYGGYKLHARTALWLTKKS